MGRGLRLACAAAVLLSGDAAAAWRLESAALGLDAAQLTDSRGAETEALTGSAVLSAENGPWKAGLRGGLIRYGGGGPAAARATSTGLADTTVTLAREILPPRAGRVSLTVGLFAKLPTARALIGTGRTDLGGQIDLVAYAGRITPFASFSYRLNGRLEGQPMRNAIQAHLGAQARIDRRLALGGYALFRQSAFRTVRDYRDLVAYGSFALSARWSLLGYGTAAVGPRAGDFGGGLQLRYQFGRGEAA